MSLRVTAVSVDFYDYADGGKHAHLGFAHVPSENGSIDAAFKEAMDDLDLMPGAFEYAKIRVEMGNA